MEKKIGIDREGSLLASDVEARLGDGVFFIDRKGTQIIFCFSVFLQKVNMEDIAQLVEH